MTKNSAISYFAKLATLPEGNVWECRFLVSAAINGKSWNSSKKSAKIQVSGMKRMLSKNIEIQKFNAYSTMYQCTQSMYIFGIQRAGEWVVERLEIVESKISKFGN